MATTRAKRGKTGIKKIKYRTLTEVAKAVAKLGLKWVDELPWIRCERGLCPIIALSRKTLKKRYDNASFVAAGQMLGMRRELAHKVARAADNRDVRGRRTLERYLLK